MTSEVALRKLRTLICIPTADVFFSIGREIGFPELCIYLCTVVCRIGVTVLLCICERCSPLIMQLQWHGHHYICYK